MRTSSTLGLILVGVVVFLARSTELSAQEKSSQLSDVPMDPKLIQLMECMGQTIHDDKQPPVPKLTHKECETLLLKEKEEEEIWRDPSLSRYITEMTTATKNVYTAQVAGMCGLRSEGWFISIRSGYFVYRDTEARRLGLTPHQLALAHKKLAEIEFPNLSFGTENNTCQNLKNSPTMNRLDELQSKLHGNYR